MIHFIKFFAALIGLSILDNACPVAGAIVLCIVLWIATEGRN